MSDKRPSARNDDNKDRTATTRGNWRKSSFSGSMGDCIEVSSSGQIEVRDSKAPVGPHLEFSARAWIAFTGNLRRI